MLVKRMSEMGLHSEHAYTAAIGSVGLSIISWCVSRKKKDTALDRADRWGIFVGQWAPTLFGLGLALSQYENKEADDRRRQETTQESSDHDTQETTVAEAIAPQPGPESERQP